jgi:hypothetical protein
MRASDRAFSDLETDIQRFPPPSRWLWRFATGAHGRLAKPAPNEIIVVIDLKHQLSVVLHPKTEGLKRPDARDKRAAFLATGLFLAINRKRLRADQVDAIQTILALAAGNPDEAGLARWIDANMRSK